jgi:hypothetical protein
MSIDEIIQYWVESAEDDWLVIGHLMSYEGLRS